MDSLHLMEGYDVEAANHFQCMAADAHKLKTQAIESCVEVHGGHFHKETTQPYGRCLSDGSPLPDGKIHIFTCYCGHEERKYDFELEDAHV